MQAYNNGDLLRYIKGIFASIFYSRHWNHWTEKARKYRHFQTGTAKLTTNLPPNFQRVVQSCRKSAHIFI